jgi:hypothetical protein
MRRAFPALVSVLIVLPAIGAIASGQLPFQLLGGLTLVLVGAVLFDSYRSSEFPARIRQRLGLAPKPRADDLLETQYPPQTVAERLLPVVFTSAVVMIVVAMAIYTGRLIGLW